MNKEEVIKIIEEYEKTKKILINAFPLSLSTLSTQSTQSTIYPGICDCEYKDNKVVVTVKKEHEKKMDKMERENKALHLTVSAKNKYIKKLKNKINRTKTILDFVSKLRLQLKKDENSAININDLINSYEDYEADCLDDASN